MTGEPATGPPRHERENFPVASRLVEPRHRSAILAFYRFARTADDVADDPTTPAAEKLARLHRIRATLAGEADEEPTARILRELLARRGLTPRHGFDLLTAFERDVTQTRYASWNELMDYCRCSAAPVGRMVLDIHNEPRTAWPASDALCAALQVINHLQDCAEDRRRLDRVYLPAADLAAAGATVAALDRPTASPALRAVIATLARRALGLLRASRPLADQVASRRLALEIALIQRIAEDLARRLTREDPLAAPVRHGKATLAAFTVQSLFVRLAAPRRTTAPPQEVRS